MEQNKVVISLLEEPMALGEIFAASGMFSDIKTQAQAVVKILAGHELGLAPLEAMTNIYIVNGKVSLQSKLIAALIKKSGKYDYQIDKLTDDECTITFIQYMDNKRVEIGKSSFTKADAAKAGVINKDVWKNYPRNMMFARALSNGARWFAADVFCGYTTEEIQEEPLVTKIISIDAKGEVTNEPQATVQ